MPTSEPQTTGELLPPNLDELLERADALLRSLKAAAPARESVEWCLANHLKAFRDALADGGARPHVENAARMLSRFCVDSMDWNTELFHKCSALTDDAWRAAKRPKK